MSIQAKYDALNASTSNFLAAQKAVTDAERELKKTSQEVMDYFADGISLYNTVIHNLSVKFRSEETSFSELYYSLYIDPQSDFVNITILNKEYVVIFKHDNVEKRVPLRLLLNDPIAISQYARQHIRSLQDASRAKKLEALSAQKTTFERAFNVAAYNLNTAKNSLDLISKQQANRKAFFEKKERKTSQLSHN